MRITIINQHPHDFVGGSEVNCDIIATYLERFGHRVTYLAVKSTRLLYDCPYAVVPIPSLNPYRLHRVLSSLTPDAVYWRYGKNRLFSSALVAKLLGCRFVYALSAPSDVQPWIAMGQTIFAKRKWGTAAWIRGVLRDLYHLSPLRSACELMAVPLFVDGVVSLNEDFGSGVPVKARVTIHNSTRPETIPFSWPRPYVVWVANLKRWKNPEKYYELAKALQTTGVDFLMIGAIQDTSYEYLTWANQGLPNFHYLGPKLPAEVNGVLRGALFLVHTCDPEGFGDIFIQAWQQGKPTVTLYFDPEGIVEREGLGCLAQTFPRLVEQTRYLIEDETERVRMGSKAREYAAEHFNPDQNVRALERFLRVVTNAGRGSA